jgi:hypothetical protein
MRYEELKTTGKNYVSLGVDRNYKTKLTRSKAFFLMSCHFYTYSVKKTICEVHLTKNFAYRLYPMRFILILKNFAFTPEVLSNNFNVSI